MTYADFESILVPEGTWKTKPEESYLYKQILKTCCFQYHYRLVCVDDKFNKALCLTWVTMLFKILLLV